MQLELFDAVLKAYSHGSLDNQSLYSTTAKELNVQVKNMIERVGAANKPVNIYKRKVRWIQQDLKHKGLITNVGPGQWRLTQEGKYQLTQINIDRYMVAASTNLGTVIWGNSVHVFAEIISEDISLCITSPPYLGIERSYGTHKSVDDYIDFVISILAPIRRRMVRGANMAINLSNDSYIKKKYGARSLYLEKLTIRLSEELDLFLMDRLVWHVANKLPGPRQFISDRHTHLTTKYEPILWLCNDPSKCLANNQNVLIPYNEQMKKLINNGGESKTRLGFDSHHKIKVGSFSNDNGGTIAGNVISIGNTCKENRQLINLARQTGLPIHSATFPVSLVKFLIKWLCPEGGLIVDPCGGWASSGAAAEELGIPWLVCELHWEYIKVGLTRFANRDGYYVNPKFNDLDDYGLRSRLASTNR